MSTTEGAVGIAVKPYAPAGAAVVGWPWRQANRFRLPGPRTDHPWVRHAARRFYGKLLRNGVRIFEYQPRVLHGKMALCDDWVSIGSSNLDRLRESVAGALDRILDGWRRPRG